ncbi:kinase-like domain-containing protein [Rhizophagus diaphanus]|nr:kinase-like domain-containing protein [Rhizophagus diaphanus] [Rhizophagus sp. MUCL 43196]
MVHYIMTLVKKEWITYLKENNYGISQNQNKKDYHCENCGDGIFSFKYNPLDVCSFISDFSDKTWQIGDLGLSQPANNTLSNNEIYGVIPYVAPEIFKGAAFSKESDIYSLGMIMWELTTGCKPFANVEHDINLINKIIDEKRPEFTNDTPEWFANLMKKCWDANPSKRPTIDEIYDSVSNYEIWCYIHGYFNEITHYDIKAFKQAEKKSLELILSKKLGPEFSEKLHPKATYTSRALSSFCFKPINLTSVIPTNVKQKYNTKEYELDINNIQSLPSYDINSSAQYSFNSQYQPLSKLNSTITENFSRKRDIDELKIEIQNDRKRVKTDVFVK